MWPRERASYGNGLENEPNDKNPSSELEKELKELHARLLLFLGLVGKARLAGKLFQTRRKRTCKSVPRNSPRVRHEYDITDYIIQNPPKNVNHCLDHCFGKPRWQGTRIDGAM